ncbi:ComEC family competence protein [Candidatus Parcubacteria bacterium]|nr:ComEC family competence protein [Candidatus Parcubacteria bacterium]
MEPEADTSWGLNPISLFIGGFAAGIFLSSFVPISPLISLLIIVVGFAVLVDKKREVVLLSIILISFGLGSLRYAVKDFHEVQTPSTTGMVVNEPEDKENIRRFVYEADNGEKVLVSAPLYAHVEYGDRVEVKAEPKTPGVIEGFDYGAYLAKDDIYWTESFAEVKVLSSGNGNALKAALLRVKNNFIAHTRAILPEPESSLLAGLIVAGKDSLPAAIVEDFRRAGIIHIVVLSGFNVTLIAEFLRKAFQKIFILANFTALAWAPAAASVAGVVLFTLMTGATTTVVRAAVMASIAVSAKLFGRSYSAPRALAFAAFLMLLENPKILVFDPSFELSFLATLGLVLFMDPISERLKRVTERWKVRETLAQTLATQLAVLPLLAYSVGNISIVSLPANILTLVIVPFTMLAGFVAVLLSYIHPVIAWPLSFATYFLLSWILFVAHFFGSLPFATVAFSATSVILLCGCVSAIFLYFLYSKWRKRGGIANAFRSIET